MMVGIYDPKPSYSVPADLKVGMTIDDLGRLHPGKYYAFAEEQTLDRLSKSDLAKDDSYSGSIALLDYPSPQQIVYVTFEEGKIKYAWVKESGRIAEDTQALGSIGRLLHRLPDKVDIRKLMGIMNWQDVKLPADAKKLASLTGKIFYFEADGSCWNKSIHFWFTDGRITKLSANVEKSVFCD